MTNKFYIGSAGYNNIYDRFNNHLYRLRGSSNIALDVKKYGLNTFVYDIKKIYDNESIDRYILYSIEQIYLYLKLPTYNSGNLKNFSLSKFDTLDLITNKLKYAITNNIYGIYLDKYIAIDKSNIIKYINKHNNIYYNNLNNDYKLL
jgi:hypothetical protein